MGKRYKKRNYHRGKRCSKGEKRVATFLDRNGIEYEMEKTFDSLKSPKNRPLRFDFYLSDLKVCIEFHGIQHYKPAHKYRKAKIAHDRTVRYDKIKKDWAINNGLILVEIPHWNIDIFEEPLLVYLNEIGV